MKKNKPNTKFKKARKSSGVSIQKLATAANVSGQTIFNYERGKCNPSDEVFARIKKALKLKGKYEDWFVRKITKKYDENSKCKRKGCDRRPVSSGFCMTHYISNWRREKRKKVREEKAAKEANKKPESKKKTKKKGGNK